MSDESTQADVIVSHEILGEKRAGKIEPLVLALRSNRFVVTTDDEKLTFTGFSISPEHFAATLDEPATEFVVEEQGALRGTYDYNLTYTYDGQRFEATGRVTYLGAARESRDKRGRGC